MTYIISMYRFTRYVFKDTRKAEKIFEKSGKEHPKGEIGRLSPQIIPLLKDYAKNRRWVSERRADDIASWCIEASFLIADSDKTLRVTEKGMTFISFPPFGIIQVILDKYSFLAGGLFTGAVVFIWHIIKG
ncbi:hypothetical protein HYS84_02030 [Candidatus Saccharibacteria bacterium]|nr:hypothetical protein [Candidatus Saccharibacteria bacterium]